MTYKINASGGGSRGPRRGGVSLSALRGLFIVVGLGLAVWSLVRTATAQGAAVRRNPASDAAAAAAHATPAPRLAPQLSADDVRRIIREELRTALADAAAAQRAEAERHAVVAAVTASHAEAVLGTVAPVARGVRPASPPRAAADEDAAALAAPALQTHAPSVAPPARRRKGAPDARSSGSGEDAGAGSIHVVVTADSSPYLHWQMRVCYHHYLKAAAAPGSAFRAFTRVLHTGKPDALMGDIPTVVVPAGPKPDSGGPPIQRPAAMIAWLEAAPPAEEFVLMLEPDHVLLRPVPIGSAARGAPVAFFFTYVDFAFHEAALAPHLARAGCTAADAARTGNSPSLMHRDDLAALAPGWRDFSLALHADVAVRDAVGWVGEMYGYSLAACEAGLRLQLQAQELMLHPPFDTQIGEASIIHYTYGTELMANGTVADPAKVPKEQRVWAFDKRYFQRDYPAGRITPPPLGAPPSVVALVDAINEALDAHAAAQAEAEAEAEAQADGSEGGGGSGGEAGEEEEDERGRREEQEDNSDALGR